MRKIVLFLALCFFILGFSSCDEGRIEVKRSTISNEGRIARLIANVSGVDNWPSGSGYSVVIAGYGDDSQYAIVTRSLPMGLEEGADIDITMSGVTDDVTSLRLCIINRLRECVATFYELGSDELSSASDTIRMEAGTVNLGMYSTIQNQIFDTKCISCHGSTGSAARGLFLTDGESYNALVNQYSRVETDMLLVSPGNVSESFLYNVLNEEGATSMSHIDLFSEDEQLQITLIDDWIEYGADE
ncbi:MAG: hypothetical protein Q4D56_01535 [Bacteroides sp.]|nr:hypothetical protein [Bacteroides sp.]